MINSSEPVRNNESASRFEVEVDGHLAKLEYMLRGNRLILVHTGVPTALEGRGIGSLLVRTGLEFARDEGLKVVPICPFAQSYIERHPEYQDLAKKPTNDKTAFKCWLRCLHLPGGMV
jgi:hypothetical protein